MFLASVASSGKENNIYITFVSPGAHVGQFYLAAKNVSHLHKKLSSNSQSFFASPSLFSAPQSSCHLPSCSGSSHTAQPRDTLPSLSCTGPFPPLPYPHLPSDRNPPCSGEIWRKKTQKEKTEFSSPGADGVEGGGCEFSQVNK